MTQSAVGHTSAGCSPAAPNQMSGVLTVDGVAFQFPQAGSKNSVTLSQSKIPRFLFLQVIHFPLCFVDTVTDRFFAPRQPVKYLADCVAPAEGPHYCAPPPQMKWKASAAIPATMIAERIIR